jgi:Putative transposase
MSPAITISHDLEPGHTHWIAARADFFLPVRVLAEVFRGKLLAKLEAAINRAKIPARRDDDPRDLLKRAARSMNGQVMDQGQWTTSKAK